MKKQAGYLILFFISFGLQILARGPINIQGISKAVDTLAYRQVGPGTFYTYMRLPELPINVHMMTIDLNNQYNTVETFQANNRVGSTENMTNAYTRMSSARHVSIGSINGNFWVVAGQGQPDVLLGVPYSGSARNGEMITEPSNWNRGRGTTQEELLNEIGFAAIDEDRKMWICDMGFDGKVSIEGVGEYPISEINRIRKTDELVFFNSYVGQTTRTDDTGTEVFIKPVEGQSWGVNKETLCEVVRIVKDKGANALEAGESVLSGNGKAKTFLENLTIGAKIKVNMGVYTLVDKLRPVVKEMVTGNALVMKDGNLTYRNTNEAYNSQLYPRTGIGMSADKKTVYLIVIDGKSSVSVGASTATMCEILKAAGAVNATSMDGGGSAQMMLRGKIVNAAADGKERAVANGWMLFSTAPADPEISKIEFSDYKLTIPANSSYRPSFLGYNQYGELINENLEGVTLSCEPTLGKVVDGQFQASGAPQKGKLIARYNGIESQKEITIQTSEMSIRLDSVLLDNRKGYPIEVLAKSGDLLFNVDPASLEWEVKNPEICKIDNGVLTGLSNGTTLVRGQFGNFNDSIKIITEIPPADKLSMDVINDLSVWTVKGSSNILNGMLTSSTFPTTIRYTYTAGRSPYVQLYKETKLYSIPDSIRVVLNTGTSGVLKAIVTVRANNQISYSPIEYTGIEAGKDYVLSLPMGKLMSDVNDRACYPVYFEGLKLMLNTATQVANQVYEIAIKEFSLVYGNINVGFTNPELISKFRIYPNPATEGVVYALVSDDNSQPTRIELYDLSGKLMRSVNIKKVGSDEIRFSLQGISSGTYLIKLCNGNKSEVVKLVVR
ncbi:phosphodiester glycosidase family protein [Bacteroides sedimenti]|uniref:T9SS C-terminal target domain-containing protein n=1 Tax=Bacteroides sedimenti TaxID=2136147 RepID=A0ABM8IIH4_9BACE